MFTSLAEISGKFMLDFACLIGWDRSKNKRSRNEPDLKQASPPSPIPSAHAATFPVTLDLNGKWVMHSDLSSIEVGGIEEAKEIARDWEKEGVAPPRNLRM
jgi:hypothetical protein